MQVGVLVRVASSDAWNDYNNIIRIIREHFLLSAYFLAAESDKRMCLLTRVYGILLSSMRLRGDPHGFLMFPLHIHTYVYVALFILNLLLLELSPEQRGTDTHDVHRMHS